MCVREIERERKMMRKESLSVQILKGLIILKERNFKGDISHNTAQTQLEVHTHVHTHTHRLSYHNDQITFN